MGAGRPPYYDNVEDLEKEIEGYWIYIKGEQAIHEEVDQKTGKVTKHPYWVRPPEHATITGLALYLGFTSRQAIMNYQEKPEFVDAIKRAKLRIEAAYEQAIHGNSPTGAIFALKNFGWTDKTEIDQKTHHSGEIKHNIDYSKLSDAALRELESLDKPEESAD